MGAQNSASTWTAGEGLGEGLNDKFKFVKQMRDASKPSLKGLAPESKAVREMGAKFDLGSKIGMTQVNTAESPKIQNAPEVGTGGLVAEVI